jgi:hypothetical protein
MSHRRLNSSHPVASGGGAGGGFEGGCAGGSGAVGGDGGSMHWTTPSLVSAVASSEASPLCEIFLFAAWHVLLDEPMTSMQNVYMPGHASQALFLGSAGSVVLR